MVGLTRAAKQYTSMRLCVALVFSALSLGLVTGTAEATDRLDEPAVKTARALNSAFLNIALAGERVVAIGERGHILYSDDAGLTWRQADVPVRVPLTAVDFVTDKIGWAVGHDTVVLKTVDGGMSWVKQLDGRDANKIRLAAAIDHLASVEAAKGQADAVSVDDAASLLEEVERDLGIGPHKVFLAVRFADELTGLAVGASGLAMATRDGGETWQSWEPRLGNGNLYHLYGVAAFEDRSFVVVGELGGFYRSEADGKSWRKVDSPTDASMFGIIRANRSDALFAFGMAGEVYRSDDRGETWGRVPSDTKSVLQNASLGRNGRVYIVGLGRVVIREAESGDAFAKVALPSVQSNTGIVVGAGGGVVLASGEGLRVIGSDLQTRRLQYLNRQ